MIGRFKGRRTFEATLSAIIEGARDLRWLLGAKRQQAQLRLLVLTAFLAAGLPLARLGYSTGDAARTLIDPVFAVLWILGGVAALAAAWQAKFHRLAALIMVGVAGLSTCISFIWLSAPDLGLTQLLVEIVALVLLLLGLRWLPKRSLTAKSDSRTPFSARSRRAADVLIACVGGGGVGAFAYALMTRPAPEGLSRFFIEQAYPGGGGTNVVNVILVDFRGFDTLGEITVLSIVALTVFSLLRRFRPAAESVKMPEQQRVQNAYDDASETAKLGDTAKHLLLVPRVTMEWLFPVVLTLSIYLLLRGHDLPGGGFGAGLTASIGIILLYIANGTRAVEARLNVQPVRWISVGLLMTTLTGAAAWLFGYPFLTTYFDYVDLPLIGKAPTASALIFDIGVFAVVVGTTVLILIALAHQSIRTPRASKPATPDARKVQEGHE